MKILVAPNAFKGSLSAVEAAACIAGGLRRAGLNAEVEQMPIADGGDDTLDVLIAAGGERREAVVEDPLGRPVRAAWGMLSDGETAVVEMARASGLKLLRREERDPLRTSTYGTGQLIAAAIGARAKRVIVGVGGSATVDGGAGCLQALGLRLLDATGNDISRGGGGLSHLRRIDASGLLPGLSDVPIRVACDVTNPALGPQGAATVFGPQKGATPEQVEVLEANLRHFFTLAAEYCGRDVSDLPRGGAAGALSGGLAACLDAELSSGADLVLQALDAERRLEGVDLVITGEGRLDSQTLGGKGPLGITRLAKARGIAVIALAGSIGGEEAALREAGFDAVLPIVPGPMPLEEAMSNAAALLEYAAARLGALLRIGADFVRSPSN